MELPQLNKDEQTQIEKHVRRHISGKPFTHLIVFTQMLALENARLAKEVNRLRALAGEELLKVYEPGN